MLQIEGTFFAVIADRRFDNLHALEIGAGSL